MKKLNPIIYNKLLLQANEAKCREMNKLASGIINSLGPFPEDENTNYNYEQLKVDIYQGLWKLATCVIKYHDLNSIDAEKIHNTLEDLSTKIIKDMENSLHIEDSQIGPLETKVPGEF